MYIFAFHLHNNKSKTILSSKQAPIYFVAGGATKISIELSA